ncbi:hypothetical protein T06_552 [Trichinella sp. T6]|nr:hypothetical protein T06_552 [Trichinella sp. T6]
MLWKCGEQVYNTELVLNCVGQAGLSVVCGMSGRWINNSVWWTGG